MSHKHITLSALASFATDPETGDAALPSRFTGELYSGAGVFGGSVYLDIASMQFAPSIPLFFNHRADDVIGMIESVTKVTNQDGTLSLQTAGKMFVDIDDDAASIVRKAQAGMQWQMSLGGFDYTEIEYPSGATVSVNGRSVTGPVTILSNAMLREGSIVALGADRETSASFFGQLPTSYPNRAEAPTTMKEGTMPEIEALKAELEAAKATIQQQATQLKAMSDAHRASDVQALFSAIGREFTPEKAAPYIELSAASFAAVAADMREASKAATLPAYLELSAFSGQFKPNQQATESELLSVVKSAHGIK